jgi:DNA-binding MarR family transcriptional regulator
VGRWAAMQMAAGPHVVLRAALSWNELRARVRADGSEGGAVPRLTRDDFEHLLAFRTSLRRFQHWSEEQAQAAGLTHVQHQLLVAVKGHPGDRPPAVGELADYLLLRHHSAVELVDRAATAGLVRRVSDPSDGRVVRVELSPLGEQRLAELTPAHLDELHRLAEVLSQLTTGWNGHNLQDGQNSPNGRAARRA